MAITVMEQLGDTTGVVKAVDTIRVSASAAAWRTYSHTVTPEAWSRVVSIEIRLISQVLETQDN